MDSRWKFGVTISALALTATACGTPSQGGSGGGGEGEGEGDAAATVDVAQYATMAPEEREPELLELCKEGDPVSVYSSLTEMESLGQEFTAKYDIPVEVYRASAEDTFAKFSQEMAAGQPGADVLELGNTELDASQSEGWLFDEYESGLGEELREGSVQEGWIATRFKGYTVAWNTNLVAPDEIPTSIQELADPKWEGRLATEATDQDWYYALTQHLQEEEGMSEEEVNEMWQAIGSNSRVVSGHSSSAGLLAAGDFAVFINAYDDGLTKLKATGAPVEWEDAEGEIAVQPVYINPAGVGIVNDSDNLACAMLFTDFLLSEEGAEFYATTGASIPSRMGGSVDYLGEAETIPTPSEWPVSDEERMALYEEHVLKYAKE